MCIMNQDIKGQSTDTFQPRTIKKLYDLLFQYHMLYLRYHTTFNGFEHFIH
jgi:hypothetical protein